MNCPHCGMAISAKASVPRGGTAKMDKRLKDDLAKATDAAGVCERSSTRADFPEGLRVACLAEAQRMAKAMADFRLLWAIYRRKDKGTPYYMAQEATEVPS